MYGRKIADLRSRKGWSQKDLADKTGCNKNTISRIENEEIGLTTRRLIQLSETLEVSTDCILGLKTARVNEVSKMIEEIERNKWVKDIDNIPDGVIKLILSAAKVDLEMRELIKKVKRGDAIEERTVTGS